MICKIEELSEVNGEEWDDFFEKRKSGETKSLRKLAFFCRI